MSFVYILINEAMPGLIKIGRTTTSVKQRISELNAPAGIPLPFTCYYAARVEDCVLVERKLHDAFGDHRVRERREFFWLSPHRAQAALELAAIEDVTPRDEIIDEYPEDAERGLIRETNRRVLPTFTQYQHICAQRHQDALCNEEFATWLVTSGKDFHLDLSSSQPEVADWLL
jgi:T5orf172 domain